MSHSNEEPLPTHTWRVLGIAAVGLLLTAVAGIALISAGVFDPKPIGRLQLQLAPGERMLDGGERLLEWLDEPLPQAPFSTRLTAAHISGEQDAGYGLALGSRQEHLDVALSPLGYVTVWQEMDGERVEHMPWQTWPHVRRGQEINELQVDAQNGQISARINRELLWQGNWESAGGNVGIYAESFGEAALIEFRDVALF